MKPSKYNLFFVHKNKDLAFNGMTSALAEIDTNFWELFNSIESIDLDKLSEKQKSVLDNMKEGGYVIEDDFDEAKFLKFKSYQSKFNQNGISLTIAPTLTCNFDCPYCYEKISSNIIDDEVIESIYKCVDGNARRNEDVYITWYGGEPLIAQNVVWDMSKKMIEICEKYQVKYSSCMVSNGYLINNDIIQKLKESKIRCIQITLDGSPEVHNSRRKLKNSDKPTFDVILDNIKKLMNASIEVSIRINIDKTNVNELEELLDILIENNLKSCSVNFGHVKPYTDACSSVSHTCLSTPEYANESLRYQKILHDKGFSSFFYPYYPSIKFNYCCADSASSFVVDPKGLLYKCWNDVGNHDRAVGNIKALVAMREERNNCKNFDLELNDSGVIKSTMLNANYLLWSPFEHEKCSRCEVLPICMGGCPYNGLKNEDNPECEKWKYNLIDVLKNAYDQRCCIV